MDISLKLKKSDVQILAKELLRFHDNLPRLYSQDGVSIMFFKNEAEAMLRDIRKKIEEDPFSRKNEYKLKLKPGRSYMIMQMIGRLKAEGFIDVNLINRLVWAIDKVAVSYKPMGRPTIGVGLSDTDMLSFKVLNQKG
jgi:hypothetical protein